MTLIEDKTLLHDTTLSDVQLPRVDAAETRGARPGRSLAVALLGFFVVTLDALEPVMNLTSSRRNAEECPIMGARTRCSTANSCYRAVSQTEPLPVSCTILQGFSGFDIKSLTGSSLSDQHSKAATDLCSALYQKHGMAQRGALDLLQGRVRCDAKGGAGK
jgi:hypothetical protein